MTRKIEGLKTAAPYLRLFKGKDFVIKVGGEVLDRSDTLDNFCEQTALLHQLGINVVVVHGGGPSPRSCPGGLASRWKRSTAAVSLTQPPSRWPRWPSTES